MSGHQEIQEILNVEDIEGLLALGAPRDEYEHEAELIDLALGASPSNERATPISKDSVKELITRIWDERFGPFSDADLTKRESAFDRVATKIAALGPAGAQR